jgi:hypothetical protein
MKKFGQSDYLNSHLVEEKLSESNNNINLDIFNLKEEKKFQQIYHKFILSVEEVKFGELKIGYIFRFELFNEKDYIDSSIITTKINAKSNFQRPPTIKKMTEFFSMASFSPGGKQQEIKQVAFNDNSENPKGINLGLNNIYIPVLN